MGVSSGGAQGAAVGVSFGTSWTDQNCVLLEQVRTVATGLKDRATAQEMMCGAIAYREARMRMGKPCKGWDKKAPKGKKASTGNKPEYTDPYIRARLGLPPLRD
jgi:hypothetical protein